MASDFPPVPYLRRSFQRNAAPSKAILHVTALGLADVELNAVPVSDDVFFPGWTDYRQRVRSQSLDITSMLNAGENVLAVLWGDGWYAGHIASCDRMFYGQQPRLKLRLEITDAAGSRLEVVSDNSWKCAQGELIASDIIMGETVDARFLPRGWNQPGFDDQG